LTADHLSAWSKVVFVACLQRCDVEFKQAPMPEMSDWNMTERDLRTIPRSMRVVPPSPAAGSHEEQESCTVGGKDTPPRLLLG
jgi:hypothetical protein